MLFFEINLKEQHIWKQEKLAQYSLFFITGKHQINEGAQLWYRFHLATKLLDLEARWNRISDLDPQLIQRTMSKITAILLIKYKEATSML